MNVEDGLRARIRELEEELREWESGERRLRERQAEDDATAPVCVDLGVTKGQARVLRLMADKAPNAASVVEINKQSCIRADITDNNAAGAQLALMRRRLRRKGYQAPFKNISGLGWVLHPDIVERVRRVTEAVNAG